MNRFFIAYTQVINADDYCRPVEQSLSYSEPSQCDICGYVRTCEYDHGLRVIHFSFSIKSEMPINAKSREVLLRETKPWSMNQKWKWSTPYGEITLHQFYSELSKEIHIAKDMDTWYTLVAKEVPTFFAKRILEEEECNYYYLKDQGHILLDRTNCCLYYEDAERGEVFAATVLKLLEIALVRMRFYEEFDQQLEYEIHRVKNLGMDLSRIDTLTIFNNEFPINLLKLEILLEDYSDPVRGLFEEISKQIGFDERRLDLRSLLQKWSIELKRWSIDFPKPLDKFVIRLTPQYQQTDKEHILDES